MIDWGFCCFQIFAFLPVRLSDNFLFFLLLNFLSSKSILFSPVILWPLFFKTSFDQLAVELNVLILPQKDILRKSGRKQPVTLVNLLF